MAHYAYLDENNLVTFVCVGKDEGENGVDWEQYYGAKRTSYNTRGGVYYDSNTGQPHADQSKTFRKNFAGIGYSYDAQRDAFIAPQPFPSWALNEDTCCWEAPAPYPQDGKRYDWNEEALSWVEVSNV